MPLFEPPFAPSQSRQSPSSSTHRHSPPNRRSQRSLLRHARRNHATVDSLRRHLPNPSRRKCTILRRATRVALQQLERLVEDLEQPQAERPLLRDAVSPFPQQLSTSASGEFRAEAPGFRGPEFPPSSSAPTPPGGPGGSLPRGSHRSGRAGLPHPARQIT